MSPFSVVRVLSRPDRRVSLSRRQDLDELIAAGRKKLVNVGGGGGAAPAASSGAGAAGGAAAAKKEEKKEESEEESVCAVRCLVDFPSPHQVAVG